jgi:hypothetical protein
VLGLVAFVAVGLFHVRAANLHAAPSQAAGESPGLFAAAFAGLFACTGFEYVPVPARRRVWLARSAATIQRQTGRSARLGAPRKLASLEQTVSLMVAAGDIDHELGELSWIARALYPGCPFRHRDSSDEE